jgi:hypothetical protein
MIIYKFKRGNVWKISLTRDIHSTTRLKRKLKTRGYAKVIK